MLNASSVAVDLSLSITGHFQARCTLIQIADDPVLDCSSQIWMSGKQVSKHHLCE